METWDVILGLSKTFIDRYLWLDDFRFENVPNKRLKDLRKWKVMFLSKTRRSGFFFRTCAQFFGVTTFRFHSKLRLSQIMKKCSYPTYPKNNFYFLQFITLATIILNNFGIQKSWSTTCSSTVLKSFWWVLMSTFTWKRNLIFRALFSRYYLIFDVWWPILQL